MKKLIMSLLISVSLITPAYAFYNSQSGPWSIYGAEKDMDGASINRCTMEYEWQDGSKFQLIKDMEDGELYIWFRNFSWNISDEPNTIAQVGLGFYGSRGTVKYKTANFVLINKNTIVIPSINAENFIPDFMGLSKLIFRMPGTIDDAQLELRGTSVGINKMIECMDVSAKKGSKDKAKRLGQEI